MTFDTLSKRITLKQIGRLNDGFEPSYYSREKVLRVLVRKTKNYGLKTRKQKLAKQQQEKNIKTKVLRTLRDPSDIVPENLGPTLQEKLESLSNRGKKKTRQ